MTLLQHTKNHTLLMRIWRNDKAGLSYKKAMFIFEDDMQQEDELFDISRTIWQSFSSEQLVRADCKLDPIQTFALQWVYCHLSDHQVVMLGVDRTAGYQLAADMLNEPIDTLSEEDEQDAVVELVNCICGQLDRDHPANECFSLPKFLTPESMDTLLNSLNKLSDLVANVGGRLFYIALFKAKHVESHGGVE